MNSHPGFRTFGLCLMVFVALSFTSQAFSGLIDLPSYEPIEWTEAGDQEESQQEEDSKKEFDSDKFIDKRLAIYSFKLHIPSTLNPEDHFAETLYHKTIDPPPEA